MIQTQYSYSIKGFRSDNGDEFINSAMSQFFVKKWVLHETTCPQTPKQNGVTERKNRHILETARAILIGDSIPQYL